MVSGLNVVSNSVIINFVAFVLKSDSFSIFLVVELLSQSGKSEYIEKNYCYSGSQHLKLLELSKYCSLLRF